MESERESELKRRLGKDRVAQNRMSYHRPGQPPDRSRGALHVIGDMQSERLVTVVQEYRTFITQGGYDIMAEEGRTLFRFV